MAEKHNMEWKAVWKDDYLAWICGFANAQGGSLYIGVADDGSPCGLANPHKLMEDIPNKIRNTMGIVADVNLHSRDGKEYIQVDVPAYPIAISYNGGYYYRSGATNQRLSGPELESFILRRRGVTWDNMPLPGFRIEDIDDNAIRRFKAWASRKGRIDSDSLNEPKEILLSRLHLVNNGFYTNAAMLVFSADPERWQLGAYTKIGFFETDADLLYQDEIHGSLLDQVDKIIEVVHLKYMKAKISYDGVQRIERYFVPDEALREAVLNALCHKDYSRGIPIQISVYNDRLYIGNCGRLPESWTLDNLMGKHTSMPYNPSIAHVFYLAGFIESWGRGIEKICSACLSDGSPLPEFEILPGTIMVKFTAARDRSINNLDGDNRDGNPDGNEGNPGKLTEIETAVLSVLSSDPKLSAQKASIMLGVSRSTVERAEKALKGKGYIERNGGTRGNWVITSK